MENKNFDGKLFYSLRKIGSYIQSIAGMFQNPVKYKPRDIGEFKRRIEKVMAKLVDLESVCLEYMEDNLESKIEYGVDVDFFSEKGVYIRNFFFVSRNKDLGDIYKEVRNIRNQKHGRDSNVFVVVDVQDHPKNKKRIIK